MAPYDMPDNRELLQVLRRVRVVGLIIVFGVSKAARLESLGFPLIPDN